MIERAHWAAVRNETIISVAINALIPTAIIWVVALTPPARFDGDDGLWSAMTKASGLATLLMTFIVTMLVRGRVRAGVVPSLAQQNLPLPLRLLPSVAVLRAVITGIVAVVVLVPIGTLAAQVLGLLPLTIGGFVVFNLVFGTLVGLTMTPLVVLRALADPVCK